MTEPLKVTLTLPPKSVERLDRLKEMVEADNYAEVIRYALQLYEWMIALHKKGCVLAQVEKDGSFKTLEVFAFSGVEKDA